jgi:putative CocE/NonD family hydrolase
VSAFGEYTGQSPAPYDGGHRTSAYLTLPDGTRLAYDLVRPSRGGTPAAGPFPVLFKFTPYLRTFTIFDEHGTNTIAGLFEMPWWERAALRVRYWTSADGHLLDPLFRTRWLTRMVRHGYAVVVVERSGTGASFGIPNLSHEAGASEAREILDWIAAQPWCDGSIGMFGDSFQAMVQFAAASTGHPNLKAIFPASSGFDTYGVTYAGGIYNTAFQSFFTWAMQFLERVVTPVDDDRDRAVLAKAIEQRRGRTVADQSIVFRKFPFRDSATAQGVQIWKGPGTVSSLLDRVNRSRIPVYLTAGWYDIFSADAFLLYANLTVPRRLTVRPIDHSETDESGADLDYGAEAHRWFDHWLKGIDSGIQHEPPIHYYVMGTAKKTAWRATDRWPLPGAPPTRLHLREGRSGASASSNDGRLRAEASSERDAFDDYTVDYTTTSGKASRWRAVNWPRRYPDMRANDARGLTYTTAPLSADVEVTGHPVLHLWLVTGAPDLDAFAYLESVDRNGRSTYVTEGRLRVSHRKVGPSPFENLGLPYHSHERGDVLPIPRGEPVDVVFALLPTSYRFAAGSRIRVAVTFADADNFETPVIDPPPAVRLLRGSRHPSFVELPVVRRGE